MEAAEWKNADVWEFILVSCGSSLEKSETSESCLGREVSPGHPREAAQVGGEAEEFQEV